MSLDPINITHINMLDFYISPLNRVVHSQGFLVPFIFLSTPCAVIKMYRLSGDLF